MYFGKPLRKEHVSLPLLLTLLLGGLLRTAQSSSKDSPDFWSTAEVTENDGHVVETLCDMSFLQTGLRTDNNVLSSMVSSASPLAAAQEPETPETDTVGLPLSLLQVDEWVSEEVQAVRAGDGFVFRSEVESKGTGFVLKANTAKNHVTDEKLPLSMDQLRVLLLVLKFLLALFVIVKGGCACTRLIQRQVAPLPTPPKEPMEAVSAPNVEKEEQEEGDIPFVSAAEVEQILPSFRGSYDCALSKPKSVGYPLRFRARIYGPLDDQLPLAAPMCEEACVLHKTKVEQNVPGEEEAKIIAERSGCVDFTATLEGAPDLQLTVYGKDLRLCSSSCRKEIQSLSAVPAKWRDFVQAEGAGTSYKEEDLLTFQEEALRVGQLVTLVGDLHRDASGQLLLEPAPAPRLGRAALAPLLDGVHVLVSDDPNFGAKTPKAEGCVPSLESS